jgi:hypothetical protein
MNKVWLVSSGSYSDYSVSCAFTTRELAIEYCARINGVTAEEQRIYVDLNQDRSWFELKKDLERLPPHIRALDNDEKMKVEDRDLYDSVPIALKNEGDDT